MNLVEKVILRGLTVQKGDIYCLDEWRYMAVIGVFPDPHYDTAYILWHDVTNSIPSIYGFRDLENLMKEGGFKKVEWPSYQNPYTVHEQIDVKVGKITFPLQSGTSITMRGLVQDIKLLLVHQNGVESIVAFVPTKYGQYDPFSISFIDSYESALIQKRLETISV